MEVAGWTPLIMLAIGIVAGFVGGVLVYRNNAKDFEQKYGQAQAELAKLKEKLGVK